VTSKTAPQISQKLAIVAILFSPPFYLLFLYYIYYPDTYIHYLPVQNLNAFTINDIHFAESAIIAILSSPPFIFLLSSNYVAPILTSLTSQNKNGRSLRYHQLFFQYELNNPFFLHLHFIFSTFCIYAINLPYFPNNHRPHCAQLLHKPITAPIVSILFFPPLSFIKNKSPFNK